MKLSFITLATSLTVLVGCASGPAKNQFYYASTTGSGDFTELLQARYKCLKEANQRVTSIAANTANASGSSQLVCNNTVLKSCLGANGWIRRPSVMSDPNKPHGFAVPYDQRITCGWTVL